MKHFLLVAISLALVSSGCVDVNAYGVYKEVDPIEKTERYEMNGNKLADKDGKQDGYSIERNDLKIVKVVQPKQKSTFYFLKFEYADSDWMFVSSGESLVLSVDGKKMTFTGEGSARNREVGGGIVRETAIYPVTVAQLRKIANAKEVIVKIIGDKGYYIKTFDAKNLENFKHFIVETVDGGTWVATKKASKSPYNNE